MLNPARPRAPTRGWRQPRHVALWFAGGLLALCSQEAAASALGSLTTSVGLLAALAGVLAIKGWPVHFAPSALSSAGGALLVAGAAWRWRANLLARRGPWVPALPVPARPTLGLTAGARPGLGIPVLPPDVGREALLVELRRHFVLLQDAWDRDEEAALAALTTPELLAELRRECADGPDRGERCSTHIVTLHAELIGFDQLGGALVASVEYSGLIREAPESGAAPFRELRMLTRSNDRAGDVWRLARHQTLL